MDNLNLSIQVNAEVIMPPVPKEIKLTSGMTMKVEDISENALRKIAQAWTKELVSKGKAPATTPRNHNDDDKPETAD